MNNTSKTIEKISFLKKMPSKKSGLELDKIIKAAKNRLPPRRQNPLASAAARKEHIELFRSLVGATPVERIKILSSYPDLAMLVQLNANLLGKLISSYIADIYAGPFAQWFENWILYNKLNSAKSSAIKIGETIEWLLANRLLTLNTNMVLRDLYALNPQEMVRVVNKWINASRGNITDFVGFYNSLQSNSRRSPVTVDSITQTFDIAKESEDEEDEDDEPEEVDDANEEIDYPTSEEEMETTTRWPSVQPRRSKEPLAEPEFFRKPAKYVKRLIPLYDIGPGYTKSQKYKSDFKKGAASVISYRLPDQITVEIANIMITELTKWLLESKIPNGEYLAKTYLEQAVVKGKSVEKVLNRMAALITRLRHGDTKLIEELKSGALQLKDVKSLIVPNYNFDPETLGLLMQSMTKFLQFYRPLLLKMIYPYMRVSSRSTILTTPFPQFKIHNRRSSSNRRQKSLVDLTNNLQKLTL